MNIDINIISAIFYFIHLLLAITIHEFSHSLAADYSGDPTPRWAGRLTLNPLAHIDPFWTILLPILLMFSGSPVVFGAAKPVPFNPHFLSNKKWGPFLIALAGPLSNFLLAIVFSFSMKIFIFFTNWQDFSPLIHTVLGYLYIFLYIGIFVNVVLGMFNLLPIPPLDGSKILYVFLSSYGRMQLAELERVGFILVILFLMLAGDVFLRAIDFVGQFLLPNISLF